MPFRNGILAGTALVRDSIHSPEYKPGVSGWSINKDGTAEFNNVDIRGSLTVTGAVKSSNFATGVSGWALRADGSAEFNGTVEMSDGQVTGAFMSANYIDDLTGWILNADGSAEFNGTVDMADGRVTGGFQSTNYVAGMSGWKLFSDGTAEFNGAIATALADGKVHNGSNVDTQTSTLNTFVTIGSANPQNTQQIAGHGYMALVQVAGHVDTVGARLRYTLWDGPVGGTQLGRFAPVQKFQENGSGRFETKFMLFAWRAPVSKVIANVNLAMEYIAPGVAGSNAYTRVDNGSYACIIWDLGKATNITNL